MGGRGDPQGWDSDLIVEDVVAAALDCERVLWVTQARTSQVNGKQESSFRGAGRLRPIGVHTAGFWVLEVCSPTGCCKTRYAGCLFGEDHREALLGWGPGCKLFEGLHTLEHRNSGRDTAKARENRKWQHTITRKKTCKPPQYLYCKLNLVFLEKYIHLKPPAQHHSVGNKRADSDLRDNHLITRSAIYLNCSAEVEINSKLPPTHCWVSTCTNHGHQHSFPTCTYFDMNF